MTDLQTIATLYEEIDNTLEFLRGTKSTAGNDSEPDPITHKQQINDQAYFVLAWGQLEADLVETCRETIRRAQQDTNWRARRAWGSLRSGKSATVRSEFRESTVTGSRKRYRQLEKDNAVL